MSFQAGSLFEWELFVGRKYNLDVVWFLETNNTTGFGYKSHINKFWWLISMCCKETKENNFLCDLKTLDQLAKEKL